MRLFDFPLSVPTYDSETDKWTKTVYDTKEEFTEYMEDQFKVPGEYNLKNTHKWKEEAVKFTESSKGETVAYGFYNRYVIGTSQYTKHWTFESEKIKYGAIYDGTYIPGFYYWYINYCPFNDDVRGGLRFGNIWDGDLYFFHYITLCALKDKHAVVVKARQRGYSLKIMALLYWSYCWLEGSVNTVGAIDKEKVGKSWKFVERYRNHINSRTDEAFIRGPKIAKSLDWQERMEMEDGSFEGSDAVLKGTTFQTDPSNGVGGAQTFFFYEEAGITKTMLETIGFIRPALEKGSLVTGMIICSGALGDLDAAESLKTVFYSPEDHNFLGVPNIWDKSPMKDTCGLFVSEAYNMEGQYFGKNKEHHGKYFMDEDGNTDMEVSMMYIKEEIEKLKASNKSDELSQLDISQKLTTPEEGFAARKTGFFPAGILNTYEQRLKLEKAKGIISCELYEDNVGGISFKLVDDRFVIDQFPFKGKKDTEKRGAVQILELPKIQKGESEPIRNTYFAGVDPIMTDETTTSESLFCIYIMKNATKRIHKDTEGNIVTSIEGYKPVAWYIGRYNNRAETNAQAEYLIRLYNAYTLVENNVTSFIDHMRAKNLASRYLVDEPTAKRIYGQDVAINYTSNRGYGIYMAPNGKLRTMLLNKQKDYVQEVMDVIRTDKGEVVRTVYGCERIKDIGLIREFKGYTKGINTDRLVAFGLALAMTEMYFNTGVITEYNEVEDAEEDYVPIKKQRRGLLPGYNSPRRGNFFSNRIKFN
jgi:hypothetical protein